MWNELVTLGEEHQVLASICVASLLLVAVAIVAGAMDWFVGRVERRGLVVRK